MTPPEYAPPATRDGRLWQVFAWGLIAAAVLFRFAIRQPTNLWEDEIIAATHAVQPFWQVIVNVIRHDVHPPLYFVQLHVWALAGHGDTWLLLNSVVWSIAAVASMWWTTSRLYGERIALIATVLFAVSPASIYMATQLRMYAMLSTLIVWAFYLAARSFGGDRRRAGTAIGLALLLIAIGNTHAIGAIAVLANGIYALSLLGGRGWPRRGLIEWFAIYAVSAVFAAPWIVTGMLHDANLAQGLSGQTVLQWLGTSGIGNVGYTFPLLLIGGAAFYAAVAAAGLLSARTRGMTAAFLVLPIVLAAASALMGKPLFKWNFFSTAASPFIAMVLAQLFAGMSSARGRHIAGAICAIAFSTIAALNWFTTPLYNDYRGVAELVRRNYHAGDLICAPQLSFFWGMGWYLVGPDWGSPLAIAPQPNGPWRKVYAKLGPMVVGRLGLAPKTQTLSANGVRIFVGTDPGRQIQTASRIWVVTTPRADLPPNYPPQKLNGLNRQWARSYGGTDLALYAASPQLVVPLDKR